jgi:hypothetical protein
VFSQPQPLPLYGVPVTRILGRISGPTWDAVWRRRKLHNEKLHNLFSPPNRPVIGAIKLWRFETCKTCSFHGKYEKCAQNFCGTPRGERPLGRRRHRQNGNIKTDLKKQGMKVQSGVIRHMIRFNGGLWWTLQWFFGFHKGRGISFKCLFYI